MSLSMSLRSFKFLGSESFFWCEPKNSGFLRIRKWLSAGVNPALSWIHTSRNSVGILENFQPPAGNSELPNFLKPTSTDLSQFLTLKQ